jgi:phage terminase large subunit-like protein
VGGLSRAERNIRWIETHCLVPEGKLVRKPVRLREWQRAELRKIYDNPHGTRQAIISFPRKNGKTALIAMLLLLHLCGPESVPNSQLYSAAMSKEQAATVFKLAAKMVRMSPDLDEAVTIRDTVKEMVCPERGTFYAALSADKSTAHGKSPVFAVHDELGQVKGPTSELYNAVETGMGAHERPLSIVISTQAPTDNDLLSRLIDDAATGRDPHTVLSLYSAPADADPFDEATLRACNPAWGDFLNPEEVLRTMEAAKAMPTQEAEYRNLHLNQRVERNAPFVSASVWKACAGKVPDFKGLPVYCGLDLSEVSDLTALSLVARDGDTYYHRPIFWLPEDGIREKSRQDREPYDVWHSQGHLQLCPGPTIDFRYVTEFLAGLFDSLDVRRVHFDRHLYRHFKPWLREAGFTDEQIEGDAALFQPFNQGIVSMTPALRDVEAALLKRSLVHDDNPVMTMCARNAVVKADANGNRKLDKQRSRGRIDGMVTLAMAMAAAVEDAVDDRSYLEVADLLVL